MVTPLRHSIFYPRRPTYPFTQFSVAAIASCAKAKIYPYILKNSEKTCRVGMLIKILSYRNKILSLQNAEVGQDSQRSALHFSYPPLHPVLLLPLLDHSSRWGSHFHFHILTLKISISHFNFHPLTTTSSPRPLLVHSLWWNSFDIWQHFLSVFLYISFEFYKYWIRSKSKSIRWWWDKQACLPSVWTIPNP